MENVNIKASQSAIEAEKVLISCILNKSPYSDDIFLRLNEENFSDYKNRIIFKTISIFRQEGKDVDTLSLIYYFESNKHLQFNNFSKYLSEISALFLHQENIKELIEIVCSNSTSTSLKNFGQKLSNINLNGLTDNDELWNLENEFLNITNNKKTKETEQIGKIAQEYKERLTQRANIDGELTGVSSGYIELDKYTNGFQNGDLIILAARPGIGKTALAINFLVNACKDIIQNRGNNKDEEIVLMFSLEMGNNQICERVIAQESGVSLTSLRNGKLTDLENTLVDDFISNAINFPLYIHDQSDLSIIDIQSKIKQLISNKTIKLIVVDYLQLLKGSNAKTQMNRQQEVALISRTLKQLARQYKVPIIAIAQLSRKIEERKGEGKKPMLSDLRESGSIEQDADLVCFINYKDLQQEEQNNQLNMSSNVLVELVIAKNRNGAIGSVDLLFNKSISKYIDVSKNAL